MPAGSSAAGGILAANNQTTDGLMRVYPWADWPSAAAWLARHLYDHCLLDVDGGIHLWGGSFPSKRALNAKTAQ
ncbi:MAG: hypothetical protein ACLFU4_10470 [Opitutales bacterium]